MSIYGIQRVVALFLRGNHGGCRFEKLRTTMVELRAVRWQIRSSPDPPRVLRIAWKAMAVGITMGITLSCSLVMTYIYLYIYINVLITYKFLYVYIL